MNDQDGVYDRQALAQAEGAVRRAADDLFAAGRTPSGPRGVVVTAPAGAGKSYLVAQVVAEARKRRFRAAVAAPTNDQAFGLVSQIARLSDGGHTCFVPAQGVTL